MLQPAEVGELPASRDVDQTAKLTLSCSSSSSRCAAACLPQSAQPQGDPAAAGPAAPSTPVASNVSHGGECIKGLCAADGAGDAVHACEAHAVEWPWVRAACTAVRGRGIESGASSARHFQDPLHSAAHHKPLHGACSSNSSWSHQHNSRLSCQYSAAAPPRSQTATPMHVAHPPHPTSAAHPAQSSSSCPAARPGLCFGPGR